MCVLSIFIYIYIYIHTQARAHIDIKGGLSTCPFFPRVKCPFFWGVFILLYFFMNICVRVCFCLCTAFPVKQIKKSKYQVGSGNETVEFRCLSPLRVSAQARAAQQCSTHRSAHAHHRHAENRRSEALPPSPVVFVLVWR